MKIARGLAPNSFLPSYEGMRFLPFLSADFDHIDACHALDGLFNAVLGLGVLGILAGHLLVP